VAARFAIIFVLESCYELSVGRDSRVVVEAMQVFQGTDGDLSCVAPVGVSKDELVPIRISLRIDELAGEASARVRDEGGHRAGRATGAFFVSRYHFDLDAQPDIRFCERVGP